MRRWVAVVAGAIVVLVPIVGLSAATVTTGNEHTDGPSPLLLVGGAVLAIALSWTLVSTLRRPRRFLLIAQWFTSLFLGLLLAASAWGLVEIARGNDHFSIGSGTALSMSSSTISLTGETGTSMSSSSDGDAYERKWLRTRYGRGAAFGESTKVNLEATSPSTAAWAWSIATTVVWLGGYAAILWLLRGVFARAARGAPFDPANARALRWIAGLIALLWLSTQTLGRAATGAVIASAGGNSNFQFVPHFSTLGAALLVLALGEIWRYGIEIQQEVEATV